MVGSGSPVAKVRRKIYPWLRSWPARPNSSFMFQGLEYRTRGRVGNVELKRIWYESTISCVLYLTKCGVEPSIDIYIQCTVWILCFLWLYGVRMLIVCTDYLWYVQYLGIQCTGYRNTMYWIQEYNVLDTEIQCTGYGNTMYCIQEYNLLDTKIQYTGYKNTIYWIQKYNILDTVTQYIFWHGCWVNFWSNDSPTKTTEIDAKPHFGEMLTVQWYLQLSSLLCRDDFQGYLESSDTTVVNFYCILPIFIILWS